MCYNPHNLPYECGFLQGYVSLYGRTNLQFFGAVVTIKGVPSKNTYEIGRSIFDKKGWSFQNRGQLYHLGKLFKYPPPIAVEYNKKMNGQSVV